MQSRMTMPVTQSIEEDTEANEGGATISYLDGARGPLFIGFIPFCLFGPDGHERADLISFPFRTMSVMAAAQSSARNNEKHGT